MRSPDGTSTRRPVPSSGLQKRASPRLRVSASPRENLPALTFASFARFARVFLNNRGVSGNLQPTGKVIVAMRTILLPALLAAAVLLGGCQAAMYRAYESFGIEKRDILVDRVSDARDAQTDAKEQFASALEQFRSIVEVDGGELERTYDRVNAEYERSVARANEVRSRIDS